MPKKTKRELIKQFEKTLNEKFECCPITKRKALFKQLEEWAYSELNDQCCELFIEALYSAKATQPIKMEIGVEEALKKLKC